MSPGCETKAFSGSGLTQRELAVGDGRSKSGCLCTSCGLKEGLSLSFFICQRALRPTLGSSLKDSMGQCVWPFMFHSAPPDAVPIGITPWCCLDPDSPTESDKWLFDLESVGTLADLTLSGRGHRPLSSQDPHHSLWFSNLTFSLLSVSPVSTGSHTLLQPAPHSLSPLSQAPFYFMYLFGCLGS